MSDTGSSPNNPKYAWCDLPAVGLPKRPAPERVADFLEIHGLYDEATARAQASRCIQCPNPTCVSGCPLCNPIPQWMQLTAEGRFLEAAAVLGSMTNMAEICTRVCPSDHLCEGNCILESVSEPVSIQAIEQFLIDYAFKHGQVDTSTAPPNGLKVAVIGSGPGGLACADELAKQGYAVTVFDSALIPGGLMVNGTPAFKIDRSVIERRLEILRARGVVFQLGVELWKELSLGQLLGSFDAVYLGFDWRKARTLDIPGADTPGVIPAIPFLLQKSTPVKLDIPHVEVEGRSVVVIGAGDTAIDCLRSALRFGARSATGLYRRDERQIPCGVREYRAAVEEGVTFEFRAIPLEINAGKDGKVAAVRCARVAESAGNNLRQPTFEPLPGTEFQLVADIVIPALGYEALPCPDAPEFGGLAKNSWGGLSVGERQQTSVPGVFAGGDLTRGPATVLHAVRDARTAANEIRAYLSAKKQTVA